MFIIAGILLLKHQNFMNETSSNSNIEKRIKRIFWAL